MNEVKRNPKESKSYQLVLQIPFTDFPVSHFICVALMLLAKEAKYFFSK